MTTTVSWDNPPWTPTEVTIRIRDYVTREFQAGVEGKRDTLPSTYEVAQTCVRGAGNAKSCRRAAKHLRLLELVGEIIRVSDPVAAAEECIPERHATFWALPHEGVHTMHSPETARIPVAVTVTALAQWQLDLIADIDAAEVAPSSW
jgi:hypothetical protein